MSEDPKAKWKEGLLDRTGTKSNNNNNYNKKRVGKYIVEFSNKYIDDIKYIVSIRGKFKMTKTVYDLREAQLTVDKFLISKGLDPIYILKKKDGGKS